MTRKKRFLLVLLVASLCCMAAVILTFIVHRPELRVVAQWKQSGNVNYKSFDPYYLSIVTRDIDYSSLPFHLEKNYFIYVGRDSGKPNYGHVIEYSFHPGFDDREDHIKRCKVNWQADGVWFEPPSGHRLFIPKDMFIGDR